MSPFPRFWAVVAAAGSGSRMGGTQPKQYLPLAGRCVIEWSLAPLLECEWIEGVVVVLAPGDEVFSSLPVSAHPKLATAVGGATRAQSVLAGLHRLPSTGVLALVHDAARPCLRRDALERLREQALGANGGLLAVPVSDTLKRESAGVVAETVSRDGLWRAQTPQLFEAARLIEALCLAEAKGQPITDEASAMEAVGARPRLVRGSESNIKITYPEDLALAEFFLRNAT